MVSAEAPVPEPGGQFFDDFYREQGQDPWGFTDRWYEQRKRAVTLAACPGSGSVAPSSWAARSACSPRPRAAVRRAAGARPGGRGRRAGPRAACACRRCGSSRWRCRRSGRRAPSTWWCSPRSATTEPDERPGLCDRAIGSLRPTGRWWPATGATPSRIPPAGRHRARGAAVPDRGGVAGPPRGGGLPPGRAGPAAGGERGWADRPAGLTERTSASCVGRAVCGAAGWGVAPGRRHRQGCLHGGADSRRSE